MRQGITFLVIICALVAATLSALGAVPQQGERPPQPFFQDFFSGTVLHLGSAPPPGTLLLACVDGCTTGFESQPVQLVSGGKYTFLEVNPSDEALIGRTVSFYLVNEFGRIMAEETRGFVGIFDFYAMDLTFKDPLPTPAPTPTATPVPTLTPTAVPRMALIIGAASVAVGAGLMLLARRRVEQ